MFVKCDSFSILPPNDSIRLWLFAPTCLVGNPWAWRGACSSDLQTARGWAPWTKEQTFQAEEESCCPGPVLSILHSTVAFWSSSLSSSFDFEKEYLKLFSEPVPKWKLQVVQSMKPRLDQLSGDIPEMFVPTSEPPQGSSIERDTHVWSELNGPEEKLSSTRRNCYRKWVKLRVG